MRRALYLVKLALAQVWYVSGAWLLWKRVRLRRRAVVLMYHRVLSPEAGAQSWSHPAIVVSPATFERQMRLLSRWFRPLSLAEFVERASGGRSFETGSCLVTFDDGWFDTYQEAWPVLRKYDVPATVFLPVRFIGAEESFWQERLGHLLFEVWRIAGGDAAFFSAAEGVLAPLGFERALTFPPDRVKAAVMDLVRAQKHATAVLSARAITDLERLLGPRAVRSEVDRFMTWEQVREMAGSGIDFGAHSVSHRLLTTIPSDEVAVEIKASRQEIAGRLGTHVAAFSYPNGDWNRSIAEAVRGEGFAVAFSTDRGYAEQSLDLYSVRRVNIHEDMTGRQAMFLARLLGVI